PAPSRPLYRPVEQLEQRVPTPVAPAPPEPEISTATDATVSNSQATEDAIAAALTEALAFDAGPVPTGPPPLTDGEQQALHDALRDAVSEFWNIGPLSSAALATTVVVGVEMTKAGHPDHTSLRLISSSGGDSDSVNQAYQAARRAIIRWNGAEVNLPVENYAQWRYIELTFNPERMRNQ
ncbi:MAG: energy transducer TonB, partial [Rhodobacteraceae bacterium]|nr:energy transducer TonB [Paracoccaceae bacterium]